MINNTNTKNSNKFLSLYFYRLKYLFTPGLILGFISIIPVLFLYFSAKVYYSYSYDRLIIRNLSPLYLFTFMVPILIIFAFKYLFSTSENDFISSLLFNKFQLFSANILAVLTYTIVPLIFVYCQRFDKYIDCKPYIRNTYSLKAIIGYIACCVLTMSCIIIGLSISNNLYIGAIAGYALIFVPRLILMFIVEKIQTRCPYLPTSELPQIINKKINIVTFSFHKAGFNNFDLKTFSSSTSIMYTGILALIYLIIGYLLFRIKKTNTKYNLINMINPAYFKKNIKSVKKIIYVLSILLLLLLFITIGMNMFCKNAEKNGPLKDKINSVQISFFDNITDLNELNDYKYNYCFDYRVYCIQQQKISDQDIINIVKDAYKDTVQHKQDLIIKGAFNNCCEVTFHTSNGTYVRYVHFSEPDQYNDLKARLFKTIDSKNYIANLPSFTDMVYMNHFNDQEAEDHYKNIYTSYKKELQEMSEEELNRYINTTSQPSDSTLNLPNDQYKKIDVQFNNNKAYGNFFISIPFIKLLPKTQKMNAEYCFNKDEYDITAILNQSKYSVGSSVTFVDLVVHEEDDAYSLEQKQLAYWSNNPSSEQHEKLNKLIDIIFNNINNPQNEYTYVTLNTDDSSIQVPLNLNDEQTLSLLNDYSK